MVAHVVIAKYLDHLPLYRQAQIYARQGIDLDRSTLANWVGRAAWWLTPLYDRLTYQPPGRTVRCWMEFGNRGSGRGADMT